MIDEKLRLECKVWKEDFWLSECKALNVMTQGKDRLDAIFMMTDAVKELGGGKIESFTLEGETEGFFIEGDKDLLEKMVKERAGRG